MKVEKSTYPVLSRILEASTTERIKVAKEIINNLEEVSIIPVNKDRVLEASYIGPDGTFLKDMGGSRDHWDFLKDLKIDKETSVTIKSLLIRVKSGRGHFLIESENLTRAQLRSIKDLYEACAVFPKDADESSCDIEYDIKGHYGHLKSATFNDLAKHIQSYI